MIKKKKKEKTVQALDDNRKILKLFHVQITVLFHKAIGDDLKLELENYVNCPGLAIIRLYVLLKKIRSIVQSTEMI